MKTPDAAEFAEIARALSEELGVQDVAARLVDFAMDVVDAEYGGVLLLDADERWDMVVASTAAIAKVDLIQRTLGEGPAKTAVDGRTTILVSDVAGESRWPEWAPRAGSLGVRSAVAAAMFTQRRLVGALTVYSTRPTHFGENEVESVGVLAQHASIVLDGSWETTGLRRAAEIRNLIGQAQGLLMERHQLGPRDAFDHLRSFSTETEMGLRMAAELLLANRDNSGS